MSPSSPERSAFHMSYSIWRTINRHSNGEARRNLLDVAFLKTRWATLVGRSHHIKLNSMLDAANVKRSKMHNMLRTWDKQTMQFYSKL
ncbi:hypothetical protein GOP47_0006416 [Adiantum capillus-veneris]|uniref:Uncharacterized protein n=1 Tax=Adiantum capillus-veneris TaxID=13818 RepID=A0A9D4ZN10_ADICA|nr:hypothetical protein GOP47_0006416 [Adiantum capillus-veneris]